MSKKDLNMEFKVYFLNRLNRLKKQHRELQEAQQKLLEEKQKLYEAQRELQDAQLKLLEEKKQVRSMDDVLTITEVVEQYDYSRKTIYRWVNKGLDVLRRGHNGKIMIRRGDLENFLKARNYGRLF